MSGVVLATDAATVRRLAAEAARRAGARRADAETVRSAVLGGGALGLYGEPLVETLREFLVAHSGVVRECAQEWDAQSDALLDHLDDLSRVEDEVVAAFAALRRRAQR